LAAWKEPATDANLHLLAYWLNKNQGRVKQGHAPSFVSTNSLGNLPSVPIFYSTTWGTTLSQTFYAITETNKPSFVLYSGNNEIGSYNLPIYNNGWRYVGKVALTPVTVTVDLTIVGGFIGYLWLEGVSNSGDSGPIYSTTVR
jgi:hypothetical protein